MPLSHYHALMSHHTYNTLAEPGNLPQITCCSRSKNSNSNSTGFVAAPFKRFNRSSRTLGQRPWTLFCLIPFRVALVTRTDFRI